MNVDLTAIADRLAELDPDAVRADVARLERALAVARAILAELEEFEDHGDLADAVVTTTPIPVEALEAVAARLEARHGIEVDPPVRPARESADARAEPPAAPPGSSHPDTAPPAASTPPDSPWNDESLPAAQRVRLYFAAHPGEWLAPRDVHRALAGTTVTAVRQACKHMGSRGDLESNGAPTTLRAYRLPEQPADRERLRDEAESATRGPDLRHPQPPEEESSPPPAAPPPSASASASSTPSSAPPSPPRSSSPSGSPTSPPSSPARPAPSSPDTTPRSAASSPPSSTPSPARADASSPPNGRPTASAPSPSTPTPSSAPSPLEQTTNDNRHGTLEGRILKALGYRPGTLKDLAGRLSIPETGYEDLARAIARLRREGSLNHDGGRPTIYSVDPAIAVAA